MKMKLILVSILSITPAFAVDHIICTQWKAPGCNFLVISQTSECLPPPAPNVVVATNGPNGYSIPLQVQGYGSGTLSIGCDRQGTLIDGLDITLSSNQQKFSFEMNGSLSLNITSPELEATHQTVRCQIANDDIFNMIKRRACH